MFCTNSRRMAAVTSALRESGIAETDVQTSRFAVLPIYAPGEPRAEPKLVGYSVSNRARVNLRQIDKVGEVLDRLVNAGVTDVGGIEFLISDPSKALDRAREAAIADARRKGEVYAQASGLRLGPIMWIREEGGRPRPFRCARKERPRQERYQSPPARTHCGSESWSALTLSVEIS
jgi:uncharacterized protein YggE